jgi:hypothetical protein
MLGLASAKREAEREPNTRKASKARMVVAVKSKHADATAAKEVN